MKVLIYVNKAKDVDGSWTKNFISILDAEKISYDFFNDGNILTDYDCVFVLGGDGTILGLVDYCAEHDIPVIGFNAGKLGFLTEFEILTASAFKYFADNNVDIGLDEYIGYESGITVIEWPQFILDLIPDNKISVSIFKMDNENDRKIIIEGVD